MAWDSSRPVPWQRLMREWVIYALIMSAIFFVLFRDGSLIGAIAGILISGPLYLLFGYALAKFGYQRKTMTQLRAERESPPKSADEPTDAPATRSRPAPTKRTSQGVNRPKRKKR
ncbi:MAG: hypothetical protein ACR2O6_00940 [Ilumatobacteraceae bacterium]